VSVALHAIADDYTGAADLGGVLWQRGFRPFIFFNSEFVGSGIEVDSERAEGYSLDAVIDALPIRAAQPDVGRQRVRALACFLERADRIYFKLDSTFTGNIGPIIETLLDIAGVDFTVVVPAWPSNGRTQLHGDLFVNGVQRTNVVTVLQAQTARRVDLIDIGAVKRGSDVVRDEIRRLVVDGLAMALLDAIDDEDLAVIAAAIPDHRLVCGASGLASRLVSAPAAVRQNERVHRTGSVLIVAGSRSDATVTQVQHAEAAGVPVVRVHPNDTNAAAHVLAALQESGAAIAAASDERVVPAEMEHALADVARRVFETAPPAGVVVTGGETAHAVLDALEIIGAAVGGVLDAGVACLSPIDGGPGLVLKPGGFGRPDLFVRAIDYFK
jgi:uncharacterized protein YgbK (DUF1537 family)